MGNTFIASQIRIEWAGEKLDQLESFIERAINDALEAPVSESSDDRMKVLLDLNAVVTPEARRLVSEYALHARAALDYIVFDLALHNTEAEPNGTQFPIAKRPEDFPWKLDKATGVRHGIGPLEHLKPQEVALVERFQPHDGFPMLQVLHGLSNRDKHRHFVHIGTTGLTSQAPTPNIDPASGTTKMEVELRRSFQVILMDADDAVTTLRILQTELTQILGAFNKLFDS
jgi:hypothetical protein